MATFTFDGTSSITATKGDTVLISADPTTFTQATDNGSSVTLAFGSQSITITGTTLAAGNLPNVFVTGGTFNYVGTTNTNGAGTGNVLSFLNTSGLAFTAPATTATSKVAIFGGLGRSDSLDGTDTINIGGKGTFLVYGNGGDDQILQPTTAFDSTSVVNVFADQGNDTVTLNLANTKASIFVGGGAGAGTDSITVINSGATTIFGGVDSGDGADVITFDGVVGAAGTSQIFGNGGNDTITVGGASQLDSTSTTTIYGGFGDDSITATAATGAKATISVLGGEGADKITVVGYGNTFITGGNQSGDQTNDGNDTIGFTGSGNTLIYGNAGADSITATLNNANDTTSISIYGGRGVDTINQTATGGKATVFISGGEDGDSINAQGNGGAVTIYGGIGNADATDGADSITYAAGSTGTANIFGNGGNDTVSIGTLGNDTTNTVTVYGGGGDDSIRIAAQSNATPQQIVINGNEGADTISIAKGTGQTITVNDFTIGSAGDKLAITGAAAGSLKVVGGSFQTLQSALDAAANAGAGTNGVGAVAFNGSTYVVINGNADNVFKAADDQAIKLTGVTDLVNLVGQTTIA